MPSRKIIFMNIELNHSELKDPKTNKDNQLLKMQKKVLSTHKRTKKCVFSNIASFLCTFST